MVALLIAAAAFFICSLIFAIASGAAWQQMVDQVNRHLPLERRFIAARTPENWGKGNVGEMYRRLEPSAPLLRRCHRRAALGLVSFAMSIGCLGLHAYLSRLR